MARGGRREPSAVARQPFAFSRRFNTVSRPKSIRTASIDGAPLKGAWDMGGATKEAPIVDDGGYLERAVVITCCRHDVCQASLISRVQLFCVVTRAPEKSRRPSIEAAGRHVRRPPLPKTARSKAGSPGDALERCTRMRADRT